MKKSIDVRTIVFLGLYVALIIAMAFIPQVGFVQIGVVAFTTIPIVITIATYHLGFKGAITSSIAFGVSSYIMSITLSPTPLADPVLMIVPRVILGFAIFAIYKLLGEIKLWKFIVLAIATVVINTLLFTTFLFIVSIYRDIFNGTFWYWVTLIYVNFFVELGIAIGLAVATYKLVVYLIEKDESHKQNVW